MIRAAHYLRGFRNFAGAAYIIEDDDSSHSLASLPSSTSSLHGKTREYGKSSFSISPHKTRDSSSTLHTTWLSTPTQTREHPTSTPTHLHHHPLKSSQSVPYKSEDFIPVKNTPISSPFTNADFCQPIIEDGNITGTHQKN